MLFRPAPYRHDNLRQPGQPSTGAPERGQSDRHTLGSIIWMAMLRLTAVIGVAFWLRDRITDYPEWWMITIGAMYGIAIYPAQIQYNYFKRTTRRLVEETLCSSCRHFNPEGLHCMLLDEHVNEQYLPCEGEGWEPKSFEDV
ncbi:MAG: hypothetical protein H7X80_01940 [bacterium]|nr:hypothetical protein [Candidatus Kapabacteria bacterium]